MVPDASSSSGNKGGSHYIKKEKSRACGKAKHATLV
jgi:hypothetical protein